MFALLSLITLLLLLLFPTLIPATPTWHPLPFLPLPLQEHSTLFLPPSTIALLGGVLPLPPNTTLTPPFATTSLLQFYNIHSGSWTIRAPLPVPMNHANAAVVGGTIYLLGGLVEHEGVEGRSWTASAGCYAYCPITDTWRTLASLPVSEARGSAAVGVWEGKIYLVGGLEELAFYGDQKQTSVSVVSVFDTVTETWETLPLPAKFLPEPRDHAGGAVVGGQMYVLGGRDHGMRNVQDTVYVLDLENLEAGWEESEARMPTPRGGVAAGVVGNRIYTFGGEGDGSRKSGVFEQVEAYDTEKDIWERVGTMRVPRHGTYAVGVEGRVYIPGGGILQGGWPVADFDVFVP